MDRRFNPTHVARHPDAAAAPESATEDVAALGFEDAFARLETTVQQLENGDLPLEQAVAAYERGLVLAQRCALLLEQVELKIRQVDASGNDVGAVTL